MSDKQPPGTQTYNEMRNAILEQCACIADQFVDLTGRSIAAAIRALADEHPAPATRTVHETLEYKEGWRDAIEQCARVVENHRGFGITVQQVAAAIRSMKDK